MAYALRVRDAEGKIVKITPLVSSLVASGAYNSPTSSTLNADNTYGFDIDLPDTSPIPIGNISVICKPNDYSVGLAFRTIAINVGGGNLAYLMNTYGSSTATYYIINFSSTNVDGIPTMNLWTAGNMTIGDATTWDLNGAIMPLTGWMQGAGVLTFSKIRIFPACLANFLDASTLSFVSSWTLWGLPTTLGVQQSTVSVIIKEWDY